MVLSIAAMSPEKNSSIITCNFFSLMMSCFSFKYKICILQNNLSVIMTVGRCFWEHPAGTSFCQRPPSRTLAAVTFPWWESLMCSEEELLLTCSCEMFPAWGRANPFVLPGTNADANTYGLILLFPEKNNTTPLIQKTELFTLKIFRV